LERHRGHVRARRRRLLLVPDAHRQHDRLLRVQHRRPGGRVGDRHPPGRRGVRGRRGARPGAGLDRLRVRGAPRRRGRRRRQIQGDPGPRQGPAGPVQVPARRPLHGGAPPQHQRQGPALQAARDHRGGGWRGGGWGMRVAIVGGGPGGLYLAALMKGLDPRHDVTVWERNAPDDTFGFGVVFSDETLGGIEGADPVVHDEMERRFARWTDIDIALSGAHGRHQFTVGGQGFAAMSRKDLLRILQQRATALGVDIRYRSPAPDTERLRAGYDLVVAADGVNSAVRARYAGAFRPAIDQRANKYIWLGTDLVFEAFQFFVKQTPWGTMQIHGYPYSAAASTFIVEMHERVWRAAGFDKTEHADFPPGASDTCAVARIGEIFADELRGHEVLTNNSRWLSFRTVRNE